MDPVSREIFLDDGEPLGIKPTVRKEGTYFFKRDPYSSEITVLEPTTRYSYLLSYKHFVSFLKGVLRLDDETERGLIDKVWNFHYAAWSSEYPYPWVVEREEYEEHSKLFGEGVEV